MLSADNIRTLVPRPNVNCMSIEGTTGSQMLPETFDLYSGIAHQPVPGELHYPETQLREAMCHVPDTALQTREIVTRCSIFGREGADLTSSYGYSLAKF